VGRWRGLTLNGKVERSHRTDKDEFYQLLTYHDDLDLEKKPADWERFYNHERTHHGYRTRGRTPASIVIGANER
jgi:transposase InsO family protein